MSRTQYLILYYFPGTRKTYFAGHLALWDGTHFISYPDTFRASDDPELMVEDLATKYGKPTEYILPLTDALLKDAQQEQILEKIQTKFFDNKYRITHRNCASAISSYLHEAGYKYLSSSLFPLGIHLPWRVIRRVRLAAEDILFEQHRLASQKEYLPEEMDVMERTLHLLNQKINKKYPWAKPKGIKELKEFLVKEDSIVTKYFNIFDLVASLYFEMRASKHKSSFKFYGKALKAMLVDNTTFELARRFSVGSDSDKVENINLALRP